MPWSTITLTVTTPMFCGGADQHAEARVPSLRGALRFWFRALAGHALGDNLAGIAKAETAVFGDTERSAPILIRIRHPVQATENRSPAFVTRTTRDRFPGIAYLLGPGLTDRINRQTVLTRGYIDVGTPIHVQLRRRPHCTDHAWDLTLSSLWLLCNFGGLGARVRRGFGGLAITGLDGLTLPEHLASPAAQLSMKNYDQLFALDPTVLLPGAVHAIQDLAQTPTAPRSWGRRSSFPVLGPSHTRSLLYFDRDDRWDTWEQAMLVTGYDTRIFRADTEVSTARYPLKRKTHEWLDVVHGSETQFPLGAMGLPVIFKEYEVNAIHGHQKTRRASPLWLRFIHTDNQWYLFSILFRTQFFPSITDLPRVQLTSPQGNRTLVVDDAALDALERGWFETGVRR